MSIGVILIAFDARIRLIPECLSESQLSSTRGKWVDVKRRQASRKMAWHREGGILVS
jgi:hypothetical protein